MAKRFGREAVRGTKEAKAAFRRIHPVMKKHTGAATRLTATRIEQEAGRRVRVMHGVLAGAIASRFTKTTGVARVGIEKGHNTIAGGRLHVPTKTAHLVEFGTVHSRAFPFMLLSAEAQKNPYLQRVRQAGKDAEAELASARVPVR